MAASQFMNDIGIANFLSIAKCKPRCQILTVESPAQNPNNLPRHVIQRSTNFLLFLFFSFSYSVFNFIFLQSYSLQFHYLSFFLSFSISFFFLLSLIISDVFLPFFLPFPLSFFYCFPDPSDVFLSFITSLFFFRHLFSLFILFII